jgi:hypothetical protein
MGTFEKSNEHIRWARQGNPSEFATAQETGVLTVRPLCKIRDGWMATEAVNVVTTLQYSTILP